MMYIRFRSPTIDHLGRRVGVFGLVNTLAKRGQLTLEQERFRRVNNDWYDAAYIDPSAVDPTVYDHSVNPGAAAWFKATAGSLLTRVAGYLAILDAHGVQWERVESADPGRVVYEDHQQVVVVPR